MDSGNYPKTAKKSLVQVNYCALWRCLDPQGGSRLVAKAFLNVATHKAMLFGHDKCWIWWMLQIDLTLLVGTTYMQRPTFPVLELRTSSDCAFDSGSITCRFARPPLCVGGCHCIDLAISDPRRDFHGPEMIHQDHSQPSCHSSLRLAERSGLW